MQMSCLSLMSFFRFRGGACCCNRLRLLLAGWLFCSVLRIMVAKRCKRVNAKGKTAADHSAKQRSEPSEASFFLLLIMNDIVLSRRCSDRCSLSLKRPHSHYLSFCFHHDSYPSCSLRFSIFTCLFILIGLWLEFIINKNCGIKMKRLWEIVKKCGKRYTSYCIWKDWVDGTDWIDWIWQHGGYDRQTAVETWTNKREWAIYWDENEGERLRALMSDYPNVSADPLENWANTCQLILICVPPLHVIETMRRLHPYVNRNTHIVSIAAGVPLRLLEAETEAGISRVIPAITSEAEAGISLVVHSEALAAEKKNIWMNCYRFSAVYEKSKNRI